MIGTIANHDANARNVRQPACRARHGTRNGVADQWRAILHNYFENRAHTAKKLLSLTMRAMTLLTQQFDITPEEFAEMRATADEIMDVVMAPGPQFSHEQLMQKEEPNSRMYVTRASSRTQWTWGGVANDNRRIRRVMYMKLSHKRSVMIENAFTQVFTLKSRDYLLGRATMALARSVAESEILMMNSPSEVASGFIFGCFGQNPAKNGEVQNFLEKSRMSSMQGSTKWLEFTVNLMTHLFDVSCNDDAVTGSFSGHTRIVRADWPSEHPPNFRDGVFDAAGGELHRYRHPFINAGLGIVNMLAMCQTRGQPTRAEMIGHIDALPMRVNTMALSGLAVENTMMLSLIKAGDKVGLGEWLKDGRAESIESLVIAPPTYEPLDKGPHKPESTVRLMYAQLAFQTQFAVHKSYRRVRGTNNFEEDVYYVYGVKTSTRKRNEDKRQGRDGAARKSWSEATRNGSRGNTG